MTQILVGLHILVSAILMINLMIAVLSDSFQRVHDNAQEQSTLQQAKSILHHEYYGMDKETAIQFAEVMKTDMRLLDYSEVSDVKVRIDPGFWSKVANFFGFKSTFYFEHSPIGGNPLVLPYDDDGVDGNEIVKASVRSLRILENMEEKMEDADLFT